MSKNSVKWRKNEEYKKYSINIDSNDDFYQMRKQRRNERYK